MGFLFYFGKTTKLNICFSFVSPAPGETRWEMRGVAPRKRRWSASPIQHFVVERKTAKISIYKYFTINISPWKQNGIIAACRSVIEMQNV